MEEISEENLKTPIPKDDYPSTAELHIPTLFHRNCAMHILIHEN
jgi:hypothetical protein